MSGANELSRDVDIDISGLFAELRRKLWLVIAVPLVVGAGLFVFFAGMDPSYKSSARIIIEKRESIFTRQSNGDVTLSGNQFDEQAVGSQVEVLASDDLALKVINRLNLIENPEFNAPPSFLGNLLAMAGSGTGSGASPQERLLKEFRSRLLVYAVEKSRVIAIEFWAHDRKLAQEVPNALADEYLAFTKQAQLQSTEDATGWLGPEIEELRARVRESEAKVAEYRANSDILVGNNNALLSTQQLSEVSSELSRVRGDRSAAEGKIVAIRAALDKGGSLDVIPEVMASQLVQRLREREVSLQAQISELGTSLGPNHPRLKALKSQAGDFSGQIRTEARNILSSLENNVDLLRRQESVLIQEVNRLKAESSRVGEAEVELRALEREAAAQRELLETYLTRYREAASRTSRDYLPIDARIISRAVMPASSFFPKVIPFTLAGVVMALVLVVVGVLAAALLSGKALKAVGTVAPSMVPERIELEPVMQDETRAVPPGRPVQPGAAERAANAPVPVPVALLAEVQAPSMYAGNDTPNRPGAANDPEMFGHEETVLAIANMGRATIAAISPGGDAGSATTWEMARLLADAGNSVVVIDLTGSAVTTLEFLGTNKAAGISDLLARAVTLPNAIFADRGSPAHIIPAGTGRDAVPDAMNELSRIAATLSRDYEFVVFDCGYAGPEGLENIADEETIIVVNAEGASRAEMKHAETALRAAGYKDAVTVRLGAELRKGRAAVA